MTINKREKVFLILTRDRQKLHKFVLIKILLFSDAHKKKQLMSELNTLV